MSDNPAPAPIKRRRVRGRFASLRAKRVLQRLREGRSHAAIAEEEGLTPRRLKEVIQRALGEKDDPTIRRAEAAIGQLAPALALAQAKIADGDLAGVRALVEVQKRIDLYAAKAVVIRTPQEIAEDNAAVDKVTRLMLHENPRLFEEKEARMQAQWRAEEAARATEAASR